MTGLPTPEELERRKASWERCPVATNQCTENECKQGCSIEGSRTDPSPALGDVREAVTRIEEAINERIEWDGGQSGVHLQIDDVRALLASLHPNRDVSGAILEAKMALSNWSKYDTQIEGHYSEEVYQANKVRDALKTLLASLCSTDGKPT
jgi:hypothetical protein